MKQEDLLQRIISYRKTYEIFKKSVESRSVNRESVMFDWPPFASWSPHFGHGLTSSMKDAIGRYKTMKWYRVVRNWGRDCHGLPVEKYVEKKLWIDGKKEIEKMWVENFIEECRNSVQNTDDERRWFVDILWRWVDMDHAYFTMDLDFMESVVWVFKNLYDRNLVYKWFKIQGYCPSCATGLSNSEINDGYKDRQDPAITVKFSLLASEKQNLVLNSKYECDEDWVTEFARAIVRNSEWKFLVLLKKQFGSYIFPGGKVEKWETPEQTIVRELKEEVWIDVEKYNFLWKCKSVYSYGGNVGGSLWNLNLFEVEYSGDPVNMELDIHWQMVWVDVVESNNEAGFAINIDWTLIDDLDDIIQNFNWLYLYKSGIVQKLQENSDFESAKIKALAWTTTPWTLPSNMFLAVGKFVKYVQIYDLKTNEYFVLAEEMLKSYYKEKSEYLLINRFNWEVLESIKYEPLFDYVKNSSIDLNFKKNFNQILLWDFVSTGTGTGIVHLAPAFGEDDFNAVCQILPQEKSLEWLFLPVDEYWEFSDLVPDYKWIRVYEANKDIIKNLKDTNKLVSQATVNHSYPHCWRCDTPLIYKAIDSWFIKEQNIAENSIENIEKINFVPELVKNRFRDTLKSAPDRNVSRNRYRWAPLPIWESDWGWDRIVIWSLDELYNCTKTWSQNITKHVLVRHGRTNFNDQKFYDWRWDSFLTELWNKQSEDLIPLLEKNSVHIRETIIAISPLQRTFLTVLPFLKTKFDSKTISQMESNYKEIQEHFFSLRDRWILLDYLKDSSTQKQFSLEKSIFVDFRITDAIMPEFNWKVFHCSYLTEIPNNQKLSSSGESIDEIYQRLSDYLDDMNKNYKTHTVITISHADNIVLMAKKFRNFSYNEKRADYKPSNASMQVYYWDNLRQKEIDLHKPYIDNYWFVKNDKKYHRVSEVLDCWFESGAMPYGQVNYLWDENSNLMDKKSLLKRYKGWWKFPYPADFIIEWLDQTRGWFRTLHILWNWIKHQNAFNNVVVNWLILAEDWKKMSKKLKNYPDPKYLFSKYWTDAYRLYVLASPAVRAEPVRFTEKWVEQVYKDFTASLTNAYNFFSTYAEVDKFVFDSTKVFFVRHAEADWTNPDAKITKNWFKMMEQKDFIEKILRTDADIIYSSGFERTKETANKIAEIIEEHTWKKVKIIQDKDFAVAENVVLAYENLLKESAGKKVILVGHNFTLSHIWAEYYSKDYQKWMWENLEIVDLPTYHIEDDLDKRILAELNVLIKQVESFMDSYLLDSATKQVLAFVDKLTNWYIRRSRRRFWESGMSLNKYSAYATLYTVLETYFKISASFAPFLTEDLWISLQKFRKYPFENWESIHLSYFPLSSRFFINQDLLNEVELVRKVISLGLFVRSKNNIKIKQPLSKMEVQF